MDKLEEIFRLREVFMAHLSDALPDAQPDFPIDLYPARTRQGSLIQVQP